MIFKINPWENRFTRLQALLISEMLLSFLFDNGDNSMLFAVTTSTLHCVGKASQEKSNKAWHGGTCL